MTDTDIEAYLDVLASVTGESRNPQSDQMFVDLFAIPETKGYLLEHHGEPAAIGLGHSSAGLVGLYNIATRPELRSRGYGRLVSEAVLRDGFGNGATGAYLRSSEMGQSLYRSMGFEAIETWTWLTRPPVQPGRARPAS